LYWNWPANWNGRITVAAKIINTPTPTTSRERIRWPKMPTMKPSTISAMNEPGSGPAR